MRFVEYALRGQQLRAELARSSPGLFFMQEFGRSATAVALVIVVLDVTSWGNAFGDAWARLRFVALFSLIMAGWNFFRARIRGDGQTPVTK